MITFVVYPIINLSLKVKKKKKNGTKYLLFLSKKSIYVFDFLTIKNKDVRLSWLENWIFPDLQRNEKTGSRTQDKNIITNKGRKSKIWIEMKGVGFVILIKQNREYDWLFFHHVFTNHRSKQVKWWVLGCLSLFIFYCQKFNFYPKLGFASWTLLNLMLISDDIKSR